MLYRLFGDTGWRVKANDTVVALRCGQVFAPPPVEACSSAKAQQSMYSPLSDEGKGTSFAQGQLTCRF